MKIIYSTVVILFLLSGRSANSQSAQNQLNQVELMKKFAGTWTGGIGKDTLLIGNNVLFGSGLDCTMQIFSKGKLLESGKLLYGYDKLNDRIIISEIFKSTPLIELSAAWFTSKTAGEMVLLRDISNPDAADLKWKFEFKSPNLIVQTAIRKGKTVKVVTLTRELK